MDLNTTRAGTRRREKHRALRRRIVSGIAATALAVAGALVATAPAQAASQGPGFGTFPMMEIGWEGGFYVDGTGTVVYCITPNSQNPTADSVHHGVTENVTTAGISLSSTQLGQINYLVSVHGQTSDNVTASAVAFAIKFIVSGSQPGSPVYNGHLFPSSGWAQTPSNYVRWVLGGGYAGATAAEADAVGALTEAYLAEAATIEIGSGSGGSGTLDFTVNPDQRTGSVVANTTPSGAGVTGTITLSSNAVFDATGTNSIAGAVSGQSYSFTTRGGDDGAPWKVTGTGEFIGGSSGWLPAIDLWESPGQQELAGPAGQAIATFSVAGEDPIERSPIFEPVAQTVAPRFVERGVAFTDEIVFDVATEVDWFTFSDGSGLDITANGTLYGPYLQPPTEQATVPTGAPIAATATVTASGPGTYTATSDTVSDEPGYYTWVWTIDADDQTPLAQRVIPDGYAWQDAFGQVIETSITPSTIVATSQVTADEAAVGDMLTDTLSVRATDGAWLRDDSNARIPVTFTGTAYWSDEEPVVSDTVPEDAESIGTTTIVANGPGSYTSPEIRAPYDRGSGYVTWVWTIDPDAQGDYAGYVDAWSDQYGLPDETTRIIAPVVTTQAQPATTLGGTIHDVATVTGPVSQDGYDLSFEAYKVPVVKDETTGEWTIDAPEGTAEGDLSWVCDSEPVFTSSEAIRVTAAGEFTSESFTPESYGKYLWVETLSVTPEDGKSIVIHRGECGVREETSFVVDVTTKAQERGKAGETATDTAIVNGFVPDGSTIEFAAYKVAEDAPQAPDAAEVCTEGTLIATTDAVSIPGGMHEGTEIVSAAVNLPLSPDGGYKVYWIETARDELGNVIAQGECGLPDETTVVEKSEGVLVWTGSDSAPALWAGVVALGLMLAGAGVLIARRRQEARV